MKPLFAIKVKVALLSRVPGTDTAKVTLSFVPGGSPFKGITAANLEVWANDKELLDKLAGNLGKNLRLEIKPDGGKGD